MLANIVLSVTAMIFSLLFLFHAYQIPDDGAGIDLGASGWPKIILGCMLLVSFLLFIRSLKDYRKYRRNHPAERARQEAPGNDEALESEKELVFRHRFWINIILIFLYITVLEYLGFILTTVLLLLVGMRLNGLRRLTHNLIISCLGVCLFVVIFIVLLNLPLPRGVGMFKELSYFIY